MRLIPRSPARKRLDNLEAEVRALSGLANPAGWLMDAMSGPTSAGQRVTVDSAMGLAAVYSAVTLISDTIGMLPFKVYRTDEEGDPVEASSHRSWRMLHDRPNDVTTAHDFWASVSLNLLLWGNAFISLERDPFSGQVETLWLEDPAGMQVAVDRSLGIKVFTKPNSTGRTEQKWNSENMVHILGPSTSGLLGTSPITICRQSLGIALARDKFESTFYARGATMRGLVQHPNLIGPDAAKNLRDSLSAIYGGAENVGQIGVLEEGASFQSVSMPLSDMEFVAAKNSSITEVASMFHLPPAYLGGSTGDSLTYATVESNKIQLATFAIAPLTNRIASAMSQHPAIFPQQNTFYAEFVQEGLLRADTQARAGYYKEALDPAHGWMTRQEVRKRENLSERDDDPPDPATNGTVPPEMLQNAQALQNAT